MASHIETKVDPMPVVKGKQLRAWLKYDDKEQPDTRQPIRLCMSKRSRGYSHDSEISFVGMTNKEIEAFESFLNGESYLRVIDGRLHAYSVHDEPPTPAKDPLVSEYWPTQRGKLRKLASISAKKIKYAPGLILSGLGAGVDTRYTTAERVIANDALALEECGFVCHRSRRNIKGYVSEVWILRTLYSAEGPLRTYMDSLDKNVTWAGKAEAACKFIASNLRIHFATLDITSQRWALSCPD